jgi:hypothetical protein
MSNVIAFPKRPTPTESEFKRFPPVTPWPAWNTRARQLLDARQLAHQPEGDSLRSGGRALRHLVPPSGWLVMVDHQGRRRRDAVVSPDARHESDSRRDAWDALVTFYDGPDEPA